MRKSKLIVFIFQKHKQIYNANIWLIFAYTQNNPFKSS